MTQPTHPSLSDVASIYGPDGDPITPDEVDGYVAAALEGLGDEDRSDQVARWVPADEGAAAWAMEHLRGLNDELADVARHRQMLLDQIEEWYEKRIRNPRARAQFFATALEEYGLRWQREDEKRRTLHLAGGGAVAVRVPKSPTVTVIDEPAVIRWAMENATTDGRPGPQDCLNTKPTTLYISEVRKWVRPVEKEIEPEEEGGEPTTVLVGVYPATGEVVPGIHVEPPGPPESRVVL